MKTLPVQPAPSGEADRPAFKSAGAHSELRLLDSPPHRTGGQRELPWLLAILLALNVPLFFGKDAFAWAFYPELVRAGQWWRIFSYPLVHVSWYHFILDAFAFSCAYIEMSRHRLWQRLSIVSSAAMGALAAAFLASPLIEAHGLCGLSGIDHGLTAVVGLEMWRSKAEKAVRLVGLTCFFGVAGKSMLEACTGNALFASWHLGSLGTPIAVCHAGGVLGALLAWHVFQWSGWSSNPDITDQRSCRRQTSSRAESLNPQLTAKRETRSP